MAEKMKFSSSDDDLSNNLIKINDMQKKLEKYEEENEELRNLNHFYEVGNTFFEIKVFRKIIIGILP
jgi:hypothetical protein